MPIYEYSVVEGTKGCKHCCNPFEVMQRLADEPLSACPECKAPVRRIFSVPSIGGSVSNFDDRAKSSGFHKLKKLGSGEYEKQY